MKSNLERIDNAFDGILSLTSVIAVILMLLLSVFVGVQVSARYLFGFHVQGLFDLSSYSLIIITFLAAAYTLREGKHISVDMLSLHLPKRIRDSIDVTMYLISIISLSILAWYSGKWAYDAFSLGLVTISETPIPKGILISSIFLGAILLIAQAIRMVIRKLAALSHSGEVDGQSISGSTRFLPFIYGIIVVASIGIGILFFVKINPVIGLVFLALVLLFSGIPVFLALGILGTIGLFLLMGKPAWRQIPIYAYQAVDSFPLTCLPLYIMGGLIFERGKIVERVYTFFQLLAGESVVAPLMTAVLIGGFFCACCGSSVATHAIISATVLPILLSKGYRASLSAGLIGGVAVGTVIPPSIGYVVYGVITGESIGKLFIGGIIPGAILFSAYGLYIVALKFINKELLFEKDKAPSKAIRQRAEWKGILSAAKGASWGLFIPFLVIGGIYLGVFTPTEAAAILVIYTTVVAIFIMKTLTWRELWGVGLSSVVVSSMILMIMVCARVFGAVITQMRIADQFVRFAMETDISAATVLMIVTVALLILGLFLDSASILIIFVPVLYPLAKGVGIDPIWFGVYFIIMTEIGLLTPPVGLNLYVIHAISGISMSTVARGSLPFVILMLITVFILYLFPSSVTWLPGTMGN